MSEISEHFRHVMLFYYLKGKTAARTCEKIRGVYGDDGVDDSTCRKWFRKFREGCFDVRDGSRNGRPSAETDLSEIRSMIDGDRRLTTREICTELNLSGITVSRHLRKLGVLKKVDTWVPRQIPEGMLVERISACDSFLKRHNSSPFLKRLVTGNETWIPYGPGSYKHPNVEPASGEVGKLRLSAWWDHRGVMYFELSEANKIVSYSSQIDNLKAAIAMRRPELSSNVVFYHEDAEHHATLESRQKMLNFGWDVLLNPSNSPDLAPTSYYLFRALHDSLKCVTLDDFASCHRHVNQFFLKSTIGFYKRGITRLPERWQMVVDGRGAYLDY